MWTKLASAGTTWYVFHLDSKEDLLTCVSLFQLPHGRYLPLTKIAQDVQTLLDECIAYNEEGERIAGGAVDHVDDNFITVAQLVDECWTN